jgi:hypothetical protein
VEEEKGVTVQILWAISPKEKKERNLLAQEFDGLRLSKGTECWPSEAIDGPA